MQLILMQIMYAILNSTLGAKLEKGYKKITMEIKLKDEHVEGLINVQWNLVICILLILFIKCY